MKNSVLYKLGREKNTQLFFKDRSVYGFCLFVGLMISHQGQAQFYNKGEIGVKENTIVSIYEDYDNTNTGDFTNDGQVYIFKNWNNDGIVNFTNAKEGKTFFNGKTDQFIEGKIQSDFQNVEFQNQIDEMLFYLGTKIAVNHKASFIKGIVSGVDLDGLVIFNENAGHEKTSDLSFVDGKVQKLGKDSFQFPVGAEKFFRPSIHAVGANENDAYTTQYFYKNSSLEHDHSQREKDIKKINDSEYWTVTKDKGTENIVLSLTLDPKTTPAEYFNVVADKQLAIVRWDDAQQIWVNEGGVVRDRNNDDPKNGATYTQVITAKVKGYGMFTIALIDKVPDDELIVYNAVSPNDDGINDTFHIKGIDKYPDNTVEIYNRWGVKVYDAKSYNESDNMFGGYSDGRATINRNEKLPTGTYFYILKYNTGTKVKEKAGYLYINNQ